MHPRRITRSCLGVFSVVLLAAACSDDEATYVDTQTASEMPGGGNDSQSGAAGSSGSSSNSSGNQGMSGSEGNPSNVPVAGNGGTSGMTETPATEGSEVEISGEINEDMTWTADKTYLLSGTSPVFLVGNHTLTIEAGTVIKGAGLGTALVVTRGSRIVANGTADKPIVFTSGVLPGLRNTGDWGGVVLLGGAPLNEPAGAIEGIAADDPRGAFGGAAAGEGDPESDCGTLKYVRIEFAGFQYSLDNELNGLTLGGCGSKTVIDYVQIHRAFDDGIEIFGGKVDIKHVVISNSADDGLDWDRGWTGRGQFIVVRTDPAASDTGIEADNRDKNNGATPVSSPTIYNITLVGDDGSVASPGIVLRRGTFGTIYDAIVTGFPVSGVDVRDPLSVAAAQSGDLKIANSIFFDNGADGTVQGDLQDDGTGVPDALDENAWLAANSNQLGVDPQLADPYNQESPNFMPAANGPATMNAVAAPMTDFFTPAPYAGAIEPGGEDWTQGWTSYPVR